MTVAPATEEELLERLRTETIFWGRSLGRIVNKAGSLVPWEPNAAQIELDAVLEAQRAADKPQRAICLKARQVGVSTFSQAKLIHRATTREYHNSVTVAHDLDTGNLLYKMGERFYDNLPDDIGDLKPPRASYRRGRELHFGELIEGGGLHPDSRYRVDTATETQAGRGATYRSAHLSEFAFWPDPTTKLAALLNAIPDDPDTLAVIESTANGVNVFKDMWDDAEAGRSEWAAFFWPWWKDETYTLPFANEAEREEFQVGEEPYGTEEPDLIDKFGLTLEQLHWRRWTIANKMQGRIEVFKQEYPSTPDEAFISSGRQVFDPYLVQQVLFDCEFSDPRVPTEENRGPQKGKLEARETKPRKGRSGVIDVPGSPLWVPRSQLDQYEATSWKVWELPKPDRQYVIGVDVSGGVAGGEQTEDDERAFDAIEVIEHQSRKQVAEYRDRVDEMTLAREVYLAALLWNNAWTAVEVTGGWGLPVARRVWQDYGFPFLFFRAKLDRSSQRTEDRLGFDTNRQTKPILEANAAEMLREKTHGIRSRALALEMRTYVKDPKGKSGPEPNRFSDLLMAWMIAQQVATMQPIKKAKPRPAR